MGNTNIEILLAVFVATVFLGDFIWKKVKGRKSDSELIKAEELKQKTGQIIIKYVLITFSSILIIVGGYYVFLTKPQLDSKTFQVYLLEEPVSGFETSNIFQVYYLQPSILFNEPVSSFNHQILNFQGNLVEFNPSNSIDFGKISRNELKSFYDESDNNFIIPYRVLGRTKLSSFLYEKFGDGFWSTRINLKLNNPKNFDPPKIKNIQISGGKSINRNNYDYKKIDFNFGNTFELSSLSNEEISKNNARKTKVKVLLEDVDHTCKYFISTQISIEDYSESKDDFLEKLDSEYIQMSTLSENNKNIELTRTISVNEEISRNSDILIFLSIFENEKYHHKLIGKVSKDFEGPEIKAGYYGLYGNDKGKDFNEKIIIDAKTWRGWRHPYEIEIFGKIDRLYIKGMRVKLDKNKDYQKIYRVLSFNVGLGYFRIPIIAYDKFGNRSETYIDGTAVPGDE